MKNSTLLMAGAAVLGLTSTLVLAQDSPEDLLPPGFDEPASPTPSATPTTAPSPVPNSGGNNNVAPAPSPNSAPANTDAAIAEFDLSNLPTLAELEAMSVDELDELLGLKPKSDIPPGAQRSMARVGVIASDEGGLPPQSLAEQPGSLVRAALSGTRGPLVSRWGHIVLRRALASRLAAPEGMAPVEFATLRARVLNGMGEHAVARALVQDVDTANYSPALAGAAVDAYVGTADITGACPAVRQVGSRREDPEWSMLSSICAAYSGEDSRAQNELRRALNRGAGERIDVLLAQRYAGAAGRGRRAVTIEWDGIDSITPWRFALATALGEPIPESIAQDFTPYYRKASAVAPMIPAEERAPGAYLASASGILSAAAMVDLYSQIYADGAGDGNEAGSAMATAMQLRAAYVGDDPARRMTAIREIWGANQGDVDYGRLVLTAYAAARIPPNDDFADDAGRLIASMLAAGLDGDALRWDGIVGDGSQGWALLALARPDEGEVDSGDVENYIDDDNSPRQAKSRMLVAGLAGLGRIDGGDAASIASDLDFDLNAQTRWTRMIDRAAQVENRALVVLLAGLGMQGDNWQRMTARHLYHIVAGLRRVGLEAEARMIAAEAVARA